jgi:hypothetical protein
MTKRIFSLAEAADYLNQSKGNLKHHYYNTGLLKGQKKGRTLVFSKAQLDWFRQIEFSPGHGENVLPGSPPPSSPTLFTMKEGAERLDLPAHTLEYHYATTGALEGRKVGHIILFTRDQLDAFHRQYERPGSLGRSRWVPVREQLQNALRKARGWHSPRVWKGHGLRGDGTWGWWAIGPTGRAEYLGRNRADALATARQSPSRSA